jgi:hypothetical protein
MLRGPLPPNLHFFRGVCVLNLSILPSHSEKVPPCHTTLGGFDLSSGELGSVLRD